MAFEDGGIWQRSLECLADGEASLEFPSCAEDLLLDLDSPTPKLTSFADATPSAVTPIEPQAPSTEARLLALAVAHHRTTAATKMPYLFGHTTCPTCQTPLAVQDAFA